MLLIIDYRESYLIKMIRQLSKNDTEPNGIFKYNNIDINYSIENLPVGDFIIKDNELDLLIIERKTTGDLCSSITDGRFRQQKERLLESTNDASKILYIIERSNFHMNDTTRSYYNGALQNLLYKHHYKLLFTENLQDTFNNLCTLYKKFINGDFSKITNVAPTKLISKSSKLSNNIFALQLSAIPGLSYDTAQIIAKAYPSMSSLVNIYIDNKLDPFILSEFIIKDKRKLGKAMSSKIYKTLFGVSVTE